MLQNENSGGSYTKSIQYPLTITVRVTREIYSQLSVIAAFEATKPSTLARRELLSMIRRYERNPQFKNWVKRINKLKVKQDASI